MGVNMARAHSNVSPRHRPTTAGSDDGGSPEPEGATATEPFPSMERNGGDLNSFNLRSDPDAQATVTDFLDFTEYLPSDMARSLTLIGSLDQSYIDASSKVHELTDLWGKLPNVPAESRPEPVNLRADISARLNQGMSSRVYAHAEALRMAENVNRHYFRAKTILSKLQTMLENYPEAEQQQQEQQQQKQQHQLQQREKEQQQQNARGTGSKPKKAAQPRIRRQPIPRITVPGEVLAPYDLDYESYSGESDISSPSSEDESPPPMRRAGAPSAAQARIKALKGTAGISSASALSAASASGPVLGTGQILATPRPGALVAMAGPLGTTPNATGTPKTPKVRMPRQPRLPGEEPYISTSSALAKLKPPPENAIIGSSDAPWLQLTPYELAKLRKRMKKNASWTPSETMIARELKLLGRNLDAFNTARKVAEEEGLSFDGSLPKPTIESDGVARVSMGALTVDAAMAAEDNHLSNRGMRLNEAKKQKNRWAQLAAQEAEESTRKMLEQARAMMSYPGGGPAGPEGSKAAPTTPAAVTNKKRKREGPSDLADTVEGSDGLQAESQAMQKRFKTETPVPIPQPAKSSGGSVPPADGLTSGSAATQPHRMRHSMTPVPAPLVGGSGPQNDPNAQPTVSRQSTSMSSPLSTAGQSTTSAPGAATTTIITTTTTVPLKPPAETPIHPPTHKSTTPIHPPVRELRTRDAARKDQPQQQPLQPQAADGDEGESELHPSARRTSRASSRALTPGANSLLPSTETGAGAPLTSTAPAPTLIAERPRRASTVRNTPVPDGAGGSASAAGGGLGGGRPAGKRIKRPAPGVVSRTSSGGSAAVGQRKAATRKKRGSNAAQQRRSITAEGEAPGSSSGEIEVDDDGNVIDPNEPRYCLCNRVSFGLMIQCDNVENCKQEWFHLECVDLTAVPARTTKWYCPDCRVLLNIGQKGEVSARGVKM
ncbi:phd-finger domain-containing protein [Ophiostoma piceae UAMH 11346]|uniref:Phd-finger domain-containing protein n=1 Tax=Ophiostoma piceae (strain UAMH 11346) TaxID=1262450 RepID=S3CU90_OPHP1|nr:phd-finger domain-containing protein [Ophiostoma piceae UAMH 11346]